jgi:uncharacterized membrane protein
LVGLLLYPPGVRYDSFKTAYNSTLGAMTTDPISGVTNIIKTAFTGGLGSFFLIIMAGSAATAFISSYLTGGGFSLLFAIPLIIIMGVVTMFALPTTEILREGNLPEQIQIIYTVFIGGLTVLTVISFMSGRQ